MITKECNTCHKLLPCTSEYFHKSKQHSGGYKNQCKKCVSTYMKEYNKTKPNKPYKYNPHNNQYVYKYRKTFKGLISYRISNIKRIGKFYFDIKPHQATLTTDQFIEILDKFSHSCSTCGAVGDMLPCLVKRLSHNGLIIYRNCIPMCKVCLSKYHQSKPRTFEQWYIKQPFYSQDRYNKIINHTKESK
ncbi:hypothetical protein [uncultured Clostridium sp.]|uniref:hypothetical protein n=1 Tax=uncultured Clostridium sp. TaxID=59620 RepID=UPI003216FDB1